MLGSVVRDVGAATVGVVSGLLLSPRTRRPRWLAVRLPDGRQRLLPWSAATRTGVQQLVVPYSAAQVTGAPDVGDAQVSTLAARQLCSYYGLPTSDEDDIDGTAASA